MVDVDSESHRRVASDITLGGVAGEGKRGFPAPPQRQLTGVSKYLTGCRLPGGNGNQDYDRPTATHMPAISFVLCTLCRSQGMLC